MEVIAAIDVPTRTGGFSRTTAADGQYSGRLPARSWHFLVTKPGFFDFFTEFTMSADAVLDVTLHPGVTIDGWVEEFGVGRLNGATVEIASGPDAGTSTTTGRGTPGTYGLRVLPGDFRVRARKDGYDPVEQLVHAPASVSLNFTLRWAYGSCLRSVGPLVFNDVPSAGATLTVSVDADPNRSWTATPDSSWLEVLPPVTQAGPGRLTFRALPSPSDINQPRKGAVQIRCSSSEGQNIWVTQTPGCPITLTAGRDLPEVFGAQGGFGTLQVRTRCQWRAWTPNDWIHTVGVSQSSGDGEFVVRVDPNSTGSPRSGALMVNDVAWQIRQQ